MNLNLLKNSLKERWLSTLTFTGGLFLYCWLIIAIIPVMFTASTTKEMENILSQYPKEILSLLVGGGTDISQFFTIEGFISLELYSLWWIIIVGGFAISLALGIIAKDTNEGTMELLLSYPLKRETVVITRLLASTIILAFLAFFTVFTTYLLSIFYDIPLSFTGLTIVGLFGWLFFEVILLFTLFLTMILKEGSGATLISFTFFLSSHILNALSSLNETIEKLSFLSIFKYYNPTQYLVDKKIDLTHLTMFLILIVALLILSVLIYRKRDISTV